MRGAVGCWHEVPQAAKRALGRVRRALPVADCVVGAELIAVGMFRLILLVGMGIALAAIVGIATSPIDVRNSWHDESLILGWVGIGIMVVAFTLRPWLGSRFGLRTLLIVTTLMALGLGLIVWASR
jgi:hypothetical protein